MLLKSSILIIIDHCGPVMVLQGDSLVVPSESYEKVYIKYSKATLCVI